MTTIKNILNVARKNFWQIWFGLIVVLITTLGFVLCVKTQTYCFTATAMLLPLFGVTPLNKNPQIFNKSQTVDLSTTDFVVVENEQVTSFFEQAKFLPLKNAESEITPGWFFFHSCLGTISFVTFFVFNLRVFCLLLLDYNAFYTFYIAFLAYYLVIASTGWNLYLYYMFLNSKIVDHYFRTFLKLTSLDWYYGLSPVIAFTGSSIFFSYLFACDYANYSSVIYGLILIMFCLWNYCFVFVILYWKLFLPLMAFNDNTRPIKYLTRELKWCLDPRVFNKTLPELIIQQGAKELRHYSSKLPPGQYNNFVRTALGIGIGGSVFAGGYMAWQYGQTQGTLRTANLAQAEWYKSQTLEAQSRIRLNDANAEYTRQQSHNLKYTQKKWPWQ